MNLARQVGSDSALISLLTGYAIELRMIDTLAVHLPRFDAQTIKDLQMRMAALPAERPDQPRRCGVEEKWALNWFGRKVKEAKSTAGLVTLLSQVLTNENDKDEVAKGPERARVFLQECGGTAEGILKFLEETRASYVLLASKLDLPLDQLEPVFDAEEKKRAGNPVTKLLFPAIRKCRQAQARMDIYRALLSAALAVQLGGRDALNNHPDPVVGGSFEYAAFEGGFVLTSKWKMDGSDKPVAVTIGQRGK